MGTLAIKLLAILALKLSTAFRLTLAEVVLVVEGFLDVVCEAPFESPVPGFGVGVERREELLEREEREREEREESSEREEELSKREEDEFDREEELPKREEELPRRDELLPRREEELLVRLLDPILL